MKHIFIIPLFIISCSSNTPRQESLKREKDSNKIAIFNKVTGTFKDSIDNLLSGEWIDDVYLKEIEQKHSVYATNEKYYIIHIYFYLDNLKSSIPSVFGSTVNEGGYDSPILYDTIRQKYILDFKRTKTETNNFEDFFEVNIINEKLLEIYFPRAKKTRRYRKRNNKTELTNLLFEGKYTDIQTGRIISVDKNGKFIGFSEESPYIFVITHFVYNINYDAIFLTKEKETGDSWPKGILYKYEFIEDTLLLYSVKADWKDFNHLIETKPDIILVKRK